MKTAYMQIVLVSVCMVAMLGTFAKADHIPDPVLASHPSPAEGQTLTLGLSHLSWLPGTTAATHDVYLGTDINDVDEADFRNALGTLIGYNQDANTLNIEDLIQNGQIYYWRVDEVGAAPDYIVSKGDIWSFTPDLSVQRISPIRATASSSFGVSGPEKTIDGSGLESDLHGTLVPNMWISGAMTAWIQYEFDQSYVLHEMWVWNSNQLIEPFVGFGAKEVTIETSTDGDHWMALEDVPQFAQAPGSRNYPHNTVVAFGGRLAKYVRLWIHDVWGIAPQTGISEVRFFGQRSPRDDLAQENATVIDQRISPIRATASGSFGVSGPEKTIDGSGLERDLHGVSATSMWLSDSIDPAPWIQYEFDQSYVLHEMWVWNSNQLIESFVGFGAKEVTIETSTDGDHWMALEDVPQFAQAPGSRDYAHNTVVAFDGRLVKFVRLWIHDVWGIAPQTGISEVRFFSQRSPRDVLAQENATVIDDFERYDNRAFNEIWAFWIDGFSDTNNGSIVGNSDGPEKVMVYEGQQSMPIHYANSRTPISEVTRTFDPTLDFLKDAPSALSLQVHGKAAPDNDAAPMYVVVTDALGQETLVMHPNPEVTLLTTWEPWHISLSDLDSLDLGGIQSITIGVGDPDGVVGSRGAASGVTGTVYVDLLRVGSPSPEI